RVTNGSEGETSGKTRGKIFRAHGRLGRRQSGDRCDFRRDGKNHDPKVTALCAVIPNVSEASFFRAKRGHPEREEIYMRPSIALYFVLFVLSGPVSPPVNAAQTQGSPALS